MADISKLEQQANLLMQNVSGWESRVLKRIGGRIGHYGRLSFADVKAINNIAVVKSDMDAITKELARVTGYNISQIEQMYGELLEEQHLANQPLHDYRGETFVPFAENRELQAIARAYAKTTGDTMINLAKTKALCVLGANGKPIGMQKYYTDVLDKAVMQVTTGATDFHTAMRDSIIELGGSGVRVDYGEKIIKGKKVHITKRLDAAVRQNLLWGAKQASTEYNTMIGEELGCDGIEVDWHSNPRPSHNFMQGKQYILGKAKTINGIYFESADEALKRLEDYGCLHYRTPIICGISEPRYSPEELKRLNEQNAKTYTIDGKECSGYEVTQMQRRLESSVRNAKTTRELAMASGDKALVKRCNAKIKAYQAKYNEISEITGIQGDKKRMSVPRSTTFKGAAPTKVELQKPKVEEPKFKVAQGKDLSGKIDYSKGDYDFDIEKAMKEQGFDGLPKVVSDEEFEEALKKSNFYAERTYSAPTQEVLDAYRDQLYNGKWYVDCSEGGSQYGKGMYCAARYEDGKYIIPKDNKIGREMSHYQEIGASKGNNFAYTEGITLTEDAKIFELPHNVKTEEYVWNKYQENYMLTHSSKEQAEAVKEYFELRQKAEELLTQRLYDESSKIYNLSLEAGKKIPNELFDEASEAMEYTPPGSKYPKPKDAGTLVAEMGYDAINAVGHGESGSYTVILNRTKCIFRKGGSMYGN